MINCKVISIMLDMKDISYIFYKNIKNWIMICFSFHFLFLIHTKHEHLGMYPIENVT